MQEEFKLCGKLEIQVNITAIYFAFSILAYDFAFASNKRDDTHEIFVFTLCSFQSCKFVLHKLFVLLVIWVVYHRAVQKAETDSDGIGAHSILIIGLILFHLSNRIPIPQTTNLPI